MKTCVICKKKYSGWGNNPAPVKMSGQCCDKCNMEYVIPARLARITLNHVDKVNKRLKR